MARAFPGFTAILFLILTAFLVPSAHAQNTGTLAGRVLDAGGAPVAGANVTVTGPLLLGTRGAVTDDNGFFQVFALPSGLCSAKISHVSYAAWTGTDVRVPLGATATLPDVRLAPAVLAGGEVVVAAEHTPIDLASASGGDNLTPADYEALPIDRNYQTIANLVPQANLSEFGDGIGIGGATGLETRYFIAGTDVTDPVSSSSSTILPYNFVREIQVRTGAYEAEYRGALGGEVEVETLSGSNTWGGQLFGFFTNDNLAGTARPGTGTESTSYRNYDIGGSIGGPLLTDRLWLLAAYNPLVSTESVPLADFGEFDDDRTVHSFASKLSWRADERNTLHLTVLGDPTSGRQVEPFGGTIADFAIENPDMALSTIEQGTIHVTGNGTHLLDEKLVLSSHAAWSRFRDSQEPEGDASELGVRYEDYVTRTLSGGPATAFDYGTTEITLGATATIEAAPAHTVKAGIDYTHLNQSVDYEFHLLSRPSDSLYVDSYQFRTGEIGQTMWGFFAQDAWRITPRWRLNAGLRWDPQLLRASDGETAQKLLDQVAPRFGVVYLPDGTGKSKVTASAGRYYQMLSLYVQQFYELDSTAFTVTQYDHDPREDPSGGEVVANIVPKIQDEVDMEGQHYDEATLGYERELRPGLTVGARGVYRTLRQGIEDGLDPVTFDGFFGNPGSEPLTDFPEMERDYAALELTAERRGRPWTVRGSYVLSRSRGNYPGLFDYRFRDDRANSTSQFDLPEMLVNATGLLPNDRTHVFKLFGSYATTFGLTLGASFIAESGIPLSEYGGSSIGYPLNFVTERGSNGRTPALWDLGLRSVYALEHVVDSPYAPSLILDIFHIGNPREVVDVDQVHYFSLDENGNQADPNPNYLDPILYQPPLAVRLGMELDF